MVAKRHPVQHHTRYGAGAVRHRLEAASAATCSMPARPAVDNVVLVG
jgi:hypothetical protein